MGQTYKLGDKEFASTGDVQQDIQIIKENFPEVDTSALEQAMKGGSFGSDLGSAPAPAAPAAPSGPSNPNELPPQIQSMYQDAYERFPTGSLQLNRAIEAADKFAKQYRDSQPEHAKKKVIPAAAVGDIANFRKQQTALTELMKLKSDGFGGKGVDTGPLMGGSIPLPFTESSIPFVPSAASQALSSGESAADRSRLRRLIYMFMNPVRKEVTGASAPMQELQQMIFPTVPNESDNDLAFYQKGMDAAKQSQESLLTTIKSLEQSGYDTAGFQEDLQKNPEQFVSELIDLLSQNKKPGAYSFPKVMKETFNERKAKVY